MLAIATATQPVDRAVRTVWLPGTPADEIFPAVRHILRAEGSVLLEDDQNRLVEGIFGSFNVRIYVPAGGSTARITCTHPAPWRSGSPPTDGCLDDLESAIRKGL